MNDNIIRTASMDDTHALVFGSSATYIADRTSGDWNLTTLRELFIPFATYRVNDQNIHARIDRVGTKCRVSTHLGHGAIFESSSIAQIDVACQEGAHPIGFGTSPFTGTRTGVRISADGNILEALSAEEVASIEKVAGYGGRGGPCWIENGPLGGPMVETLDEVPAKILCGGSND